MDLTEREKTYIDLGTDDGRAAWNQAHPGERCQTDDGRAFLITLTEEEKSSIDREAEEYVRNNPPTMDDFTYFPR